MLVLTRKADQRIHIGRDVTVTILRIQGRSVKIGIQAPSGITVFRGELLDKPRSTPPARTRRAPRDPLPSSAPPASRVGPASLISTNAAACRSRSRCSA
jgi:carbon storage regulator